MQKRVKVSYSDDVCKGTINELDRVIALKKLKLSSKRKKVFSRGKYERLVEDVHSLEQIRSGLIALLQDGVDSAFIDRMVSSGGLVMTVLKMYSKNGKEVFSKGILPSSISCRSDDAVVDFNRELVDYSIALSNEERAELKYSKFKMPALF